MVTNNEWNQVEGIDKTIQLLEEMGKHVTEVETGISQHIYSAIMPSSINRLLDIYGVDGERFQLMLENDRFVPNGGNYFQIMIKSGQVYSFMVENSGHIKLLMGPF